jgi:hypothetical protein
MGVFEAVAEGNRLRLAERNERLGAEAAALAAKQAAAAEAEGNADLDRRRQEARVAASLDYVHKHRAAGVFGSSALKANAAETAFNAALADPSSSVETLFSAWSAYQSAAATHRIVHDRFVRYGWTTANPGRQYFNGAYVDHTIVPSFASLLDRVVAARTALSVKAAPDEAELYAKADEAGDKAAQAIQ